MPHIRDSLETVRETEMIQILRAAGCLKSEGAGGVAVVDTVTAIE